MHSKNRKDQAPFFSGLRIGHYTNLPHKTGLTVFLFDQPSACGRHLCGAAPATRDCDLLSPENFVDAIDAVTFTGGSAFGLDATAGVMQWLKQKNRGWPTRFGQVPIVPAAAIYDFQTTETSPPLAEHAYDACQQASRILKAHGRVGAGTGALVGKLIPHATPSPGGFGYAKMCTPQGLSVAAFTVVNPVGDVYEGNTILAGSRLATGAFADTQAQLLNNAKIDLPFHHRNNTTLALIVTNAAMTKNQLTRVSKMASAGLAQAIKPIFTPFDGDIVFSVSLGKHIAEEINVGVLAAEALRLAIIHAVS